MNQVSDSSLSKWGQIWSKLFTSDSVIKLADFFLHWAFLSEYGLGLLAKGLASEIELSLNAKHMLLSLTSVCLSFVTTGW
jgi:hypothetical protein